MPFSDKATHPHVLAALTRTADQAGRALSVLDCGMGAGTLGGKIKAALPGTRLTGVEVFLPYIVDRELLGARTYFSAYDSIIAGEFGDMRWLVPTLASLAPGMFDVVLFGDSLEHLAPEEARRVLFNARRLARLAVLVNAPIAVWDQGPVYGNEAERHRLQWPRARWEELGGRYLGGSDKVACFEFCPMGAPA